MFKKVAKKASGRGLSRIVRAFGWSIAGFRSALRYEEAFRQEVFLCCILVPAGLWLGETGLEKAMLTSSVLLVPIVELLNSAVESTVDRISSEQHPLSGRAKDLGSAAVFLSLVNVFAVWVLVLFI
jgi:diacylglycerol kinase (ATP)